MLAANRGRNVSLQPPGPLLVIFAQADNYLFVDLLVLIEHLDVLFNPPGTGFGLFCIPDLDQDRIAVAAVQLGPKNFRIGILVQLLLKISWYARSGGRVVGVVPAPILLGQLDFTQPGWFHFSLFDEPGCPHPVSLRPLAACCAPGETLQPEPLIIGGLLPIYPSMAESTIHGLRVGHRLDT